YHPFQHDARNHTKIHNQPLPMKPFVSILVATYNEQSVINRLMRSCHELTYGLQNFEVIVVDDSNDGTFDELKKWLKVMPNIKIVHRNKRVGWKGGAINLAVQSMDKKSAYALIVDADHVLDRDALQKFVQCFMNSNKLVAVQGFPIPSIGSQNSWVARGIYFRLARRNLIEFVAKNNMELPLQITGSLFMIRSDVFKKIRFSHEMTEDWELTLDLHLKQHIFNYKKILFYPYAISHCEAPARLYTYFKQRLRVSEGHTRSFKKRIPNLLRSNISVIKKIELFFTGTQYAKFLLILALGIVNSLRIVSDDILPIESSIFFVTSLAIQTFSLVLYVVNNIISTHILGNHNFNYTDVLYLITLNVCTFPAFVIGSLRGALRKNGTFHKTERN
ncbi:MAG: glycosyltransferase, partial [Nitrosopumilaceae archaeon]